MIDAADTADEEHGLYNTTVRGMRSTVGREATTFGFSILATVSFGVVQSTQGSPGVMQIFLFAIGAVMSFTLLEGILSRGFVKPMPQHPTQTLALGTSLNIVSVTVGLGAAVPVSHLLTGNWAWTVAPLAAGIAYLITESLELALAEKFLRVRGDRTADEVSP